MSKNQVRTGVQSRSFLLFGFGGLLVLLAFTGLNALSALKNIESRSEAIRQDYVNRNRILQELRSNIYLSGTHARDLLLEPNPPRADSHRNELHDARVRIESMIRKYGQIVSPEEREQFQQFSGEVSSYFDSLQPVLVWNAAERRKFGFAFMQSSLLPRRLVIVRLADQISALNSKQLDAENRQLAELFSSFRKNLTSLLVGTLLFGALLAGASVYRVLRLEHLSHERLNQVEEARTQLRELSARLLEVQESERRAISRELHDEVGQQVSALLLGVGNAAATLSPDTVDESKRQLQDIRRVAEKTVAAVRDISLLLRPSMLDDLGLIPALEWQAREISRSGSLRVTVSADELSEEITDEQKTCIYRVAQEALRNVTRHANARLAEVKLWRADGLVHLSIHDNGKGFSPEREKGLGLLGIKERAIRLNGCFCVQSHPGGGTTVSLEMPVVFNGRRRDAAVS